MHSFAWWPTVIVLGVATFTDLRSRRIPNWLVLPFLAVGVAVSSWLHGWHGLGTAWAERDWAFDVRISFLHGRNGRRRCEALRGDWGLDRPDPIVFRHGVDRFSGWTDGVGLGGVGRLFGGVLPARGRPGFQSKERGEAVLSNPRRRKMPYAPAIAIGTLISFFAH